MGRFYESKALSLQLCGHGGGGVAGVVVIVGYAYDNMVAGAEASGMGNLSQLVYCRANICWDLGGYSVTYCARGRSRWVRGGHGGRSCGGEGECAGVYVGVFVCVVKSCVPVLTPEKNAQIQHKNTEIFKKKIH